MPGTGPSLRLLLVGLAGLILAAGLVLVLPLLGGPALLPWPRSAAGPIPASEPSPAVELIPNRPNTLRLAADVARTLGVKTAAAQAATRPRTLTLPGRLALNANRLARVHARFPGEVVEIGQVPDRSREGQTVFRPLRPGDRVTAGQLLAVVWSKDVGEKKSELVDALSQLHLDQESLDRLEDLYRSGNTSEASLRQMRRNVESDRIAVAKAERTLRSWRLTDTEIDAVRAEAERLRRQRRKRDTTPNRQRDRDWAKVEVRARLPGTVVEKNVALGDLVDTATDLFKIADMRTLAVWADAYEEDLPALLALSPDQRQWTVRLEAEPDAAPLEGEIDYLGEIIDPNQHTALVVGRVANPDGRLRAGQFVTVAINLPPPPDEVLIPTTAVVEDGQSTIVFVQDRADPTAYSLRRVFIARRLPAAVAVRSRLTPDQKRHGLQAVEAGERVVTDGAVELKKALEDLQAARSSGGE